MHDLELIRVGKTYPDGTVAVSEFDLQVSPGEFVAFVGPSGCGKSTTLRMVAGFEAITHGDIIIKGKNVSAIPAEKRPTSMIFQNYALFPHLNVRDNIGFGLDVKGVARKERDAKVDRILDMFDLSQFADRKADRLSGGQRQRIALARGLVVEPEILLLDEPLGALDANLRRVIQNELKLLQRELGITFVFVTHAQDEALGLSDRVIVMNNGQVEQIGRPEEIYGSPMTEFVARFIGANAIFEGRDLRQDAAGHSILTAHGRITGHASSDLRGTSAIIAAVPAEAIRIGARTGDQSVPNRLHGTIDTKHRIGSICRFKVSLSNGQAIDVETASRDRHVMALAAGDHVDLDCPPERVSLLPTHS